MNALSSVPILPPLLAVVGIVASSLAIVSFDAGFIDASVAKTVAIMGVACSVLGAIAAVSMFLFRQTKN
jgi:hypothetical protein